MSSASSVPWVKIVQDLSKEYPKEVSESLPQIDELAHLRACMLHPCAVPLRRQANTNSLHPLTSPAQSLSTLTSSGTPTTRSIVHRQLHLPDSSASSSSTPIFVSTTDVRSAKATQINPNSPHVSLNWWFPTPNSQIRVKGTAVVIPEGDDRMADVRKQLWETMSGHLRATFARTRAPGSKMDAYDDGKDWPETLPTLEVSARYDGLPSGRSRVRWMADLIRGFALT